MFTAGCKASGPPGPPLHPPWNPWNIQLSQGTGQGVSMTFNAASRLRSLEDRSAALGSRRCELPGMHSVPKSAVLPYASGVGGLSRRLLNIYKLSFVILYYIHYTCINIYIYIRCSPRFHTRQLLGGVLPWRVQRASGLPRGQGHGHGAKVLNYRYMYMMHICIYQHPPMYLYQRYYGLY